MEEQKMDLKLGGMVIGIFFIIIIGILMVNIFFDAGSLTGDETFEVDDPDLDQVCTLQNTPTGSITVLYYNGVSWSTVSSSDYDVDGDTVTVDADAFD